MVSNSRSSTETGAGFRKDLLSKEWISVEDIVEERC